MRFFNFIGWAPERFAAGRARARAMGEILPFQQRSRPRAALRPPEGPAKILFFLGVRYERHDDGANGPHSQKPTGSASRRSRRRKRA
jgi:hypothetical protein